MKLFLVRHGESEANKQKIVQGHFDSELTDLGFKQAKKIANRLKNYNFNKIYSSDLKRAKDTAIEIGKFHENEIIFDEQLREISRGDWSGKSYDEVDFDSLEGDFFSRKPPKGESALDQIERIKIFLNKNDFNDNTLLVVHGGVIKSVLSLFLGIDKAYSQKIKNSSLTIIDLNNKKIELSCCVKHLEEGN